MTRNKRIYILILLKFTTRNPLITPENDPGPYRTVAQKDISEMKLICFKKLAELKIVKRKGSDGLGHQLMQQIDGMFYFIDLRDTSLKAILGPMFAAKEKGTAEEKHAAYMWSTHCDTICKQIMEDPSNEWFYYVKVCFQMYAFANVIVWLGGTAGWDKARDCINGLNVRPPPLVMSHTKATTWFKDNKKTWIDDCMLVPSNAVEKTRNFTFLGDDDVYDHEKLKAKKLVPDLDDPNLTEEEKEARIEYSQQQRETLMRSKKLTAQERLDQPWFKLGDPSALEKSTYDEATKDANPLREKKLTQDDFLDFPLDDYNKVWKELWSSDNPEKILDKFTPVFVMMFKQNQRYSDHDLLLVDGFCGRTLMGEAGEWDPLEMFMHLYGASGVGKTTLIKLLIALLGVQWCAKLEFNFVNNFSNSIIDNKRMVYTPDFDNTTNLRRLQSFIHDVVDRILVHTEAKSKQANQKKQPVHIIGQANHYWELDNSAGQFGRRHFIAPMEQQGNFIIAFEERLQKELPWLFMRWIVRYWHFREHLMTQAVTELKKPYGVIHGWSEIYREKMNEYAELTASNTSSERSLQDDIANTDDSWIKERLEVDEEYQPTLVVPQVVLRNYILLVCKKKWNQATITALMNHSTYLTTNSTEPHHVSKDTYAELRKCFWLNPGYSLTEKAFRKGHSLVRGIDLPHGIWRNYFRRVLYLKSNTNGVQWNLNEMLKVYKTDDTWWDDDDDIYSSQEFDAINAKIATEENPTGITRLEAREQIERIYCNRAMGLDISKGQELLTAWSFFNQKSKS